MDPDLGDLALCGYSIWGSETLLMTTEESLPTVMLTDSDSLTNADC